MEGHAAVQRFWFHGLYPNSLPVPGHHATARGSEEERKRSSRRSHRHAPARDATPPETSIGYGFAEKSTLSWLQQPVKMGSMMKHVHLTALLAETQLLRLSFFPQQKYGWMQPLLQEGRGRCRGRRRRPNQLSRRRKTRTGRAWPGAARLHTLACTRTTGKRLKFIIELFTV